MPQTIYIVTVGEDNSYHIVGVFLDKAKAERCRDLINPPVGFGGDLPDIEEWIDGEIDTEK